VDRHKPGPRSHNSGELSLSTDQTRRPTRPTLGSRSSAARQAAASVSGTAKGLRPRWLLAAADKADVLRVLSPGPASCSVPISIPGRAASECRTRLTRHARHRAHTTAANRGVNRHRILSECQSVALVLAVSLAVHRAG
jgi:hypothetical protein